MLRFLGFPDIEGFHNVVKVVETYPHLTGRTPIVRYRAKIKLHGTNAAVRCERGEIHAQSRTQLIDTGSDNAGFARWLESRRDFFGSIASRTANPDESGTVFGEWCGPGIMKGTAINRIPYKIFAVFAVMLGDVIDPADPDYNAVIESDPDQIRRILQKAGPIPEDIHVLPWFGETYEVNFSDRDGLQLFADTVNRVVSEIEPCDPWVRETFGVAGTAEGLVYVPGPDLGPLSRGYYSSLCFKAKGEKHKVVKTREPVQVDPQVLTSVNAFVTMFATENRFEQGMAVQNLNFEMVNMGKFLKWVGQDVLKESEDERVASGLEWGQVAKPVQTAARDWFLARNRAL